MEDCANIEYIPLNCKVHIGLMKPKSLDGFACFLCSIELYKQAIDGKQELIKSIPTMKRHERRAHRKGIERKKRKFDAQSNASSRSVHKHIQILKLPKKLPLYQVVNTAEGAIYKYNGKVLNIHSIYPKNTVKPTTKLRKNAAILNPPQFKVVKRSCFYHKLHPNRIAAWHCGCILCMLTTRNDIPNQKRSYTEKYGFDVNVGYYRKKINTAIKNQITFIEKRSAAMRLKLSEGKQSLFYLSKEGEKKNISVSHHELGITKERFKEFIKEQSVILQKNPV